MTSKEASESKLSLLDLISKEELQQLQDSFALAVGMAATITDTEGVPITKPSNHGKVCEMVRATKRGLAKCVSSGKALGVKSHKLKQPTYHQCFSCGFYDAAAPIVVEGQHLGNWLFGQYYVGDVDEDSLAAYAEEIGADKEEMLTAFREMTRVPLERFMHVLNFLGVLTNRLSSLAHSRLVLQNQLHELNQMQDKLREHQEHLEEMVDIRTQQYRNTMKKLQNNERSLRVILESLTTAVVLVEPEHATIAYINTSGAEMIWIAASEVKGRDAAAYLTCAGGRDLSTLTKDNVGAVLGANEHKLRKAGGEVIPVFQTSILVELGGKLFVLENLMDISRLKEAEKERLMSQSLQVALETAGAVCHEMNQPLQTVMAFAGAAYEDLEDGNPLREDMEVILGSIKQLKEITGKLQHITTYETMDYTGDTRILDLNLSSTNGSS